MTAYGYSKASHYYDNAFKRKILKGVT